MQSGSASDGALSVVKRAAVEELDMEFFFEEAGAALGVAEIFGYVAVSLHLKSDGASLEGGVQAENSLAVGMVQPFGDAHDGSEAARDALVDVDEAGISGVMAVRL
jgi:hypothetical protein